MGKPIETTPTEVEVAEATTETTEVAAETQSA